MTILEIWRRLLNQYPQFARKVWFDEYFIIARYLYRPVSFVLSTIFIKLGVSANAVTFLNLILTLVMNGMFLLGDYMVGLAAALLYLAIYFFDYSDGNIARFHGTANVFGKFFDGLVDAIGAFHFVPIAVYSVVTFEAMFSLPIEIGLGVGTCVAALFNQYFHMRLRFFLGEAGYQEPARAEDQSAAQPSFSLRRMLAQLSWLQKNILTAAPLLLFPCIFYHKPTYYLLIYAFIYIFLGLGEVVLLTLKYKKALSV